MKSRAISKAFTLIELLVVIAIIAILSAIILASLSEARERGREASIRSTLKSMSNQIELMRADSPDYSFVNSCATDAQLKKFVDSMVSQGATVACDSATFSTDVYSRWGVTAGLLDETDLTAWTASPLGVMKWDIDDTRTDGTPGTQVMPWAKANTACATKGGHLPTTEQLRSLYKIVPHPVGYNFTQSHYWSLTEDPSDTTYAYKIKMNSSATIDSVLKTASDYVRCVS